MNKTSTTSQDPEKVQESDSKSRFIGLGLVVILLALLAANSFGLAPHCGKLRPPQKGTKAPEFVLKDLDGKIHRLNDYRGKVIIVDFWATWCPACVANLPGLEKIYQLNKEKGLVFLAVSLDQDLSALKRFIDKRKVSEKGKDLPTVLTKGFQTANLYGVSTLPHLVLIDQKGVIRYSHIGRGGQSELAEHVISLLGE